VPLSRAVGFRPPWRRRERTDVCDCCREQTGFCWTCRCGLSICQRCMQDNLWGMTCNNITWWCPDCGARNGFGNQ